LYAGALLGSKGSLGQRAGLTVGLGGAETGKKFKNDCPGLKEFNLIKDF
jgi:hypothetical protein